MHVNAVASTYTKKNLMCLSLQCSSNNATYLAKQNFLCLSLQFYANNAPYLYQTNSIVPVIAVLCKQCTLSNKKILVSIIAVLCKQCTLSIPKQFSCVWHCSVIQNARAKQTRKFFCQEAILETNYSSEIDARVRLKLSKFMITQISNMQYNFLLQQYNWERLFSEQSLIRW